MKHSALKYLALCASLLVASASTPATAHHAFAAQYDSEKPVTLTGVVVKIDWLNPHAYFYIDVEDETTGEIATWASELTSPVGLMRRGWTRNSMKIGDIVVVDGILARDGSAMMNAQSVVLTSTGQKLFTRSPGEERLSNENRNQR
ncbi:DUF6152 family protein [Candidatus Rariloculus sp.]|uniref:DUF6152 family protein n=1 Tax=Candidatus Rariloculus sp. TaxID=3101265 RepID=UPI003D0D237B